MLQDVYEEMVRFASAGDFADELIVARAEYVARTGDMFETDSNFESRIAAFLEWYIFDRPIRGKNHTPAKLYIDSVRDGLTTPDVNRLRGLTRTILSLFQFKKVKGDIVRVVDLLSGEKFEVVERRKLAGVDPGDILEARLVPIDDKHYFAEAFTCHPRESHKAILKAAKVFRENGKEEGRGDLVHRVAYLSNRCERYKHVSPKQIFNDLNV
ncbi:MAG: hypothetical protein A2289_05040 [Deltaproteobacteria bacterium RIFOXYA12_FULL_58_15]|nr:MAG: hypothetical protein A2289_05040 [Deltaproteobacteria bacterium RIFOXYA12_FULL_58_15]OGR09386.1 MAG: hypothetical protein A2341_18020 [Deltaproteobacteria bacterium RIFOXYB12_FULL_58_9]